MSYKTNYDQSFFLDLVLAANYFFHNKVKKGKNKKNINQKIKIIAKLLKLNIEDIEYIFLFLTQNNILYEKSGYYFVNLNILIKHLKKEKKDENNTIIAQSNFELIVKPELSLISFFKLIQFSVLKSRDVVFKFVITENSLHNAYTQQVKAKEVKSFLAKLSSQNLPHNLEYLIDDIYNRYGEIKLGYASGYMIAKNHIMKALLNDPALDKDISKPISHNTCLLTEDVNIWDLFHDLKAKNFFPEIDSEKVGKKDEDFYITLHSKEVEYLLTTFHTLKEIGFHHDIKVDFNILNNLIDHLEMKLPEKVRSKAAEKSIRYKQELKNSIKSYVLKSLKASIQIPQNLVLNKVALHYEGENPATTKKDIIKIVNYCLSHKLKFLIGYHTYSKKAEEIIEPKYLYEKKVLYYYNRDTKEEEHIEVSKIIFAALI